MESPAKKRGLFGLSGFFRSSTAPPVDSDAASRPATTSSAVQSPLPSRGESGNASAPESPVKRASDTQLASRKILGRPQGPSSKLSQSFSASDFDRSSSVPPLGSFPPRRKPGDNPYKTSTYSSSTISHVPTSSHRATNFSGASTTPRNNIFRSSALYQRPGLPTFSPRVPANTMTQSFPPNTPGKAPRGSSADVSGRGLANATSTELFEMRIPSPPRHLTGEALTRELRDLSKDSSHSGSVYADEFLSHFCPPDLDEHQRRQFFCILDLRRLKYSADEVFTKKDWKINVLNFAKEFEKNRSLIMLRYGLYEFKTVRASEAVKKEWRQKHGIAESESESEPTPAVKANVGSKRKAEDDLKSTDSVLTTSSSNANKRVRAPEPTSVKSKRKADAEPDENQPAKLLKPATTPQKTPSAAKAMFESVTNKPFSSATPAKPPAKNSLFSSTAPKLPNGNGGRSVFEANLKPAAVATNIFGHLSDTSKGSPNDDADAESETDSGDAEGESELQEASPSDGPSTAASGDAPTPQFGAPATLNGTSSASSDAGGNTNAQGRSLFDRVTRGSDGQPVRKLPAQESRSPFAASPDEERPASPAKEVPAAAPVNNTWNANTPIKFGGNLFGSTASQPAAIDFGASAAKKRQGTPEQEAQQPTQNLFGGLQKKADEPVTKPNATPKAAPAQPLFGFGAKPAASPSSTPNLFGSTAPASTSTSIFGSGAPVFGQPKVKEEGKTSPTASTPAPPAPNLFGTTPAAPADVAAKQNVFQSSTLFGKVETAPQAQTGSIFGKTQSNETPAAQPAAAGLFGQAKPLFGAAPSQTSTFTTEEPAAKKISFGGDAPKQAPIPAFAFGSAPAVATDAAKPAVPESKSLFGATSTAPAAPETKSLFGATAAASAVPATKNLFGASSAAPQESKPLFGAAPAAQSGTAQPLFGATPIGQPAAVKPAATMFASATPAPAPASSGSMFNFGGSQTPAASQPATSQPAGTGSIFGTGGGASFDFSAGGGASSSTFNNPFAAGGTASAPSSFAFGSGGNNNTPQPASTSFTFGAAPAAPTISFGAGSDSSSQAPQQGNMFSSAAPSFNFGGNSSQPNGASMFSHQPPSTTSMFGNSLAPGGGTSTGTNSPFTFGGASSLATTPATGTPEPVIPEDSRGTNADGDEAPQEQLSLTEGGPGEEDEVVVHEVRAKAVKLVIGGDSEDDDSGSAKDKKNPWVTQGVGPLRLLKNKDTGAVRMLLRAEPRGHVALNKLVLPNFTYKVEPAGSKYVKLTTATDDGKGLETWMLQVKTADAAKLLAESLEASKKANAKS